jgi:hypothetical protein
MSTTVLAILLILYIFATIIAGKVFGNKKLVLTEGKFVTGIRYYIWTVLKQAFFSFIFFAIVILILELITKQDFYGYLVLIILGAANFFYARYRLMEDWRIMFKKGEGN